MNGFLHIPFWRTGGWEEISYRTQLYLTPLSREPVQLGIYLYENGGKPWSQKSFTIEIDQHIEQATTNHEGMLDFRIGPGQTVRIEINAMEHEYGTGEVHLLSGSAQIHVLARGDLEVFAQEASGFELSTSEITITGGRPAVLEPGR